MDPGFRSTDGRFPAECRRFLRDLALHAEHEQTTPEHAAACPKCAARLQAARRQVVWLRALPRVVAPGDAAQGLDAVHDRAIGKAERTLGRVLRQTLEPSRAPGDVVWQELTEPRHLGPVLRRLWPVQPAPAWMWRRIRARLRPEQESRHAWLTPARVGLVAAALIVSAMLLFSGPHSPARIRETAAGADIVWVERSQPIDPTFSLQALARIGR